MLLHSTATFNCPVCCYLIVDVCAYMPAACDPSDATHGMLPSNAALFAATSVLQKLCCYLFADVCVCAVCVLCAPQIKEGARLCAVAQFKDKPAEYNAAYRRTMWPEEKATKKAMLPTDATH